MTSAAPLDPSPSEIERALALLEREGDVQGVVRIVELWERSGQVSLAGLLAQARAFLRLCLMDRAWVRLREAAQRAPDNAEVLALTARVFLARGWPSRAQRLLTQLQELHPAHPELPVLLARVGEPPPAPPANARELERSTDTRQLLSLVEIYLATGSFLRARSLLDRIKRLDPHNYRVDLLSWGVQGDFLPRGRSLAELVREAVEPGDWDAAEHTVNARRAELLGADPPTMEAGREVMDLSGPSAAFPDLFRGPGPRGGHGARGLEPADEEVTAAMGLATPEQMQEVVEDERTDGGLPPEEGTRGDTQIMQVIRKPGGSLGLVGAEGHLHQEVAPPAAPPDPLDLRAWQRSLGVAPTGVEEPAPAEEPSWLEAEDEDLVVLTRREEAPAPPEPAPAREHPIEVIEKHPSPPLSPPPVAPFLDVDTQVLPRRRPSPSPAMLVGLLGVLLLMALLGTAFLTMRLLSWLERDGGPSPSLVQEP